MSLAVVHTRAIVGVEAVPVEVEVLTSNGLPGISIVGLPEAAVRESKDRVRGALLSSGFKLPQQRITINLAPADLPKEGGRFDLPIAIGVLVASDQVKCTNLDKFEFIGELALSGDLRPVHGILPSVLSAKNASRQLIIPPTNSIEAGIVPNARTLMANNLLEVSAHLSNELTLPTVELTKVPPNKYTSSDMSDIKGQNKAKRALEIAAAGRHNILFIGPPGTGKTMLANRLVQILPNLTVDEAIETAIIHSISTAGFEPITWRERPVRTPHHSASSVALVGGGSIPKPGEISLAHHGILFLDELPEFGRKVLEALREPLESGEIKISRATQQVQFNADFMLVASMNPCPCGYLGDYSGRCQCTNEQVKRYRSKISGPLLDRIDMHIEVPRVPISVLQDTEQMDEQINQPNTSEVIKNRVKQARIIQLKRANKINYNLKGDELNQFCNLETAEKSLIEQAMERLSLSARSYHRILRIARTIADLAQSSNITKEHLAEAISYRLLDRT